jgi:hypothetical protein
LAARDSLKAHRIVPAAATFSVALRFALTAILQVSVVHPCPTFFAPLHLRAIALNVFANDMTLGQLLDDIRDPYVNQFSKRIALLAKEGIKVISEAAYRNEHGALVREGILGFPLRADLITFADGQTPQRIMVDSEIILSFEPFSLNWDETIPILLKPFYWDACRVRVCGIGASQDWASLKKWHAKWFDEEDTCTPDEHGLFGVVHFVSAPERDGAADRFEVDFGTAPVEAFEELLDAFQELGASKVEIGQ